MTKRTNPAINLAPILGEKDAQLVAQAIFALQRERVAAFTAAKTIAMLRGDLVPSEELFALDEVPALARRLGAAPFISRKGDSGIRDGCKSERAFCGAGIKNAR